jgi:hypothetical protein
MLQVAGIRHPTSLLHYLFFERNSKNISVQENKIEEPFQEIEETNWYRKMKR